MRKIDTTLYLVTNSTGRSEEEFLRILEEACAAGVTLVQLREKERGGREYLHLAQAAKAVTDKYNIPLLIDDRVDVAMACGCAGVHVGQSDIPVNVARQLLGPDKIVGATAKTVPQAVEAYEQGADYLGVGAIYPTKTKVITVITSIDHLKDICEAVPIPVNAIGGLKKENIGVLKGSGIAGICVVSNIMEATNPGQTTRELKAAVKEIIG
jgi:thiamine-phosphate pyrophosphorylase